MGGANEGMSANFTFGIMRSSPYFDNTKILLLLGGQAGWAGNNLAIDSHCSNYDVMPLAPYFGDLTNPDTVEDQYGSLYAFPVQQATTGQFVNYIKQDRHNNRLGIYEINFGYTSSNPNCTPSCRNPWMTGVAGGINLPWSMLQYLLNFNSQPMCAFSILQYSYVYAGNNIWSPIHQCDYPQCSFARLWGMLRDLNGKGTRRPTWLADTLANMGIFPTLITTVQSGDNPTWNQTAINYCTFDSNKLLFLSQ